MMLQERVELLDMYCRVSSAAAVACHFKINESSVRTTVFFCVFLKLIYVIYLFLAALGLCCCARAFSSCGERASHCSGFSCCRARALGTRASGVVARGLWSAGSEVVVHGLSCSVACGIFPDKGSHLCPLHWQADS